MPAAQEEGTRGTFFCFLAMPGPNRWNTGESTARGSNDPPNQSQDQAYQAKIANMMWNMLLARAGNSQLI